MTRTCDAEWYLKHCQRAESITAQKVCNQCASDRVGSVLPGRGFEKGNSSLQGYLLDFKSVNLPVFVAELIRETCLFGEECSLSLLNFRLKTPNNI